MGKCALRVSLAVVKSSKNELELRFDIMRERWFRCNPVFDSFNCLRAIFTIVRHASKQEQKLRVFRNFRQRIIHNRLGSLKIASSLQHDRLRNSRMRVRRIHPQRIAKTFIGCVDAALAGMEFSKQHMCLDISWR